MRSAQNAAGRWSPGTIWRTEHEVLGLMGAQGPTHAMVHTRGKLAGKVPALCTIKARRAFWLADHLAARARQTRPEQAKSEEAQAEGAPAHPRVGPDWCAVAATLSDRASEKLLPAAR